MTKKKKSSELPLFEIPFEWTGAGTLVIRAATYQEAVQLVTETLMPAFGVTMEEMEGPHLAELNFDPSEDEDGHFIILPTQEEVVAERYKQRQKESSQEDSSTPHTP